MDLILSSLKKHIDSYLENHLDGDVKDSEEMYKSDVEDLKLIYDYIENGQFTNAYELLESLDTAVYESVPKDVIDYLESIHNRNVQAVKDFKQNVEKKSVYTCAIYHIHNQEMTINTYYSLDDAHKFFTCVTNNDEDLEEYENQWNCKGFDFRTEMYHYKMSIQ